MIIRIVIHAIFGVFGGILRSIAGWTKNNYKRGEKFSFAKMFKSISKGALIGLGIGLTSLHLPWYEVFFYALSGTYLWEDGLKGVWGLLKKKLLF